MSIIDFFLYLCILSTIDSKKLLLYLSIYSKIFHNFKKRDIEKLMKSKSIKIKFH